MKMNNSLFFHVKAIFLVPTDEITKSINKSKDESFVIYHFFTKNVIDRSLSSSWVWPISINVVVLLLVSIPFHDYFKSHDQIAPNTRIFYFLFAKSIGNFIDNKVLN